VRTPLKARLRERNVHPDFLGFAAPELVQKTTSTPFSSNEEVADKIRVKSGS